MVPEKTRVRFPLTRSRQPSTTRICFLTENADGIGGIARTVNTLANHLAQDHDVEIISVYRRRATAAYPRDPKVRVTYLQDAVPVRDGRQHSPERGYRLPTAGKVRNWLGKRPSRIAPHDTLQTALTDLLMLRKLRTLPSCVLISTRPALHAMAAALAPRHVITVGQDHMNFKTRASDAEGFDSLLRSIYKLDAWTVLTEADVHDYQPLLANYETFVSAIPNASPWPVAEQPAPLHSNIVIAAGRLITRKGYERMITAWAAVAPVHADWQLHIYGTGDQKSALQAQIRELGLTDSIKLKGHTMAFEEALAGASVYAMTSRAEGFPMVLVEAISKGLPLVSMDCPRGPGEIVVDGSNGRLIPDGDIEGFSQALLQVIGDDELRARMAETALKDAQQYTIETIAQRWNDLFERLGAARSR